MGSYVREKAWEIERWGQIGGNLRDLACTREEQTGTQLSEEARREQNNSSSSLSLSLSTPHTPAPLLSSSLVPLSSAKKSEAQHDSLLHDTVTPGRAESGAEGATKGRQNGALATKERKWE